MQQTTLDFGPSPVSFLYEDAANDPAFSRSLFTHAKAKRAEFARDARQREWSRLFKVQHGCCADCGRHTRKAGPLKLDHRAALINGGGNAPSNLQLLCVPCHDLKTSQDIALHRRLLAAT